MTLKANPSSLRPSGSRHGILRVGICTAICLTCSLGLADEGAPRSVPAVKLGHGKRAIIRAAAPVPKRGRGLKAAPSVASDGTVERPGQLAGVESANRTAPRQAALAGRPTPAVPPQAPPPVEFEGLVDRSENLQAAAAEPAMTRAQESVVHNHSHHDHSPQNDSHHAARNTRQRHRITPSHRQPFRPNQSPTFMRRTTTSTVGKRLPQGFAARISSLGDNGQRPIPAFRQMVESEDRMANLRAASPSMSISREQRLPRRNEEFLEREPRELLSFDHSEVVSPTRDRAEPLSSFIIVAPPAGTAGRLQQSREQLEPAFDSTETRRPRRMTVAAEYDARPITTAVDNAVATDAAPTVNRDDRQTSNAAWPFSAFTAARWGAEHETAAKGAGRFATRKPGLAAERAGGYVERKERLIDTVIHPAETSREKPTAAAPATNDQSTSRPPRRANFSIAARIFRRSSPTTVPATTRLVALHQSTEDGSSPGRREAASTIEVLPTLESSDSSGVQMIDAVIELPEGEFPPDAAAERFTAAGTVFHSTGTSNPTSETLVLWEAPATCQRASVFDDPNVERHGYSAGLFQPVLSAAHFFGRVPALPYLMAANGTGHGYYTLGHFRPGSYAPYQVYLPPLTLKGLSTEATSVLGLLFLIP